MSFQIKLRHIFVDFGDLHRSADAGFPVPNDPVGQAFASIGVSCIDEYKFVVMVIGAITFTKLHELHATFLGGA